MDNIPFEPLAQRKYVTADGSLTLEVIMGRPQPMQDEDGSDYLCPVKFIYNGKEQILPVAGVDAFQAISLAFKLIDYEVRKDGRLLWEGVKLGDARFPDC